eukprot:TRINITY_DN7330_c0_g1_i2.p1 TRINITY_DN7330_c0_g1~~TRINITY_DN7330_c0_g1_i2.p1  ORF type:complete len:500 (+),score=141.67 TRINITY_DN7330_c0_g1_i2:2-1501(+)
MDNETYKVLIFDLLQKRNDRNSIYTQLFESYNEIYTDNIKIKSELKTIANDNDKLKKENLDFQLKLGIEDDISNKSLQLAKKKLEEQINELQMKLSESYQKNTENVEKSLNALQQQKELEIKLDKKTEEQNKLNEENLDLKNYIQKLTETLNGIELKNDVLKNEVKALNKNLVEGTKELENLKHENKILIDRWSKKKKKEAEEINKQNEELKLKNLEEISEELNKKAKENLSVNVKVSDYLLGGSFSTECHLPNKTPKRIVQAHKGEVNCISYNISGSRFATSSNDKFIKLWDSPSSSQVGTLTGSVTPILKVEFSMNEEFLLGVSTDDTVRVWSLRLGRVKETLTGHTGKVFSAAFTSDSQKILTGGHDRTIKVYDVNTGNGVNTIFCGSSCNDLCVTSYNQMVVSGHVDGSFRAWDLRSGKSTYTIPNLHSKQITSVITSPDGNFALTSGRDNTLKLTDFRTWDTVHTYSDEGSENLDRRCEEGFPGNCINPGVSRS